MKALVYEGPEHLAYRDVEDAAPQEGEVLVRVESVGICGSDMHAFLGHDARRPAPLILGHEVAGVRLDTGARVTVNPLVTTGQSDACKAGKDNLCPDRQIISMPPRQGGFTEVVAIPPRNVVEIPDGTSDDQAALAEPLACGWHTVRLCHRIADPGGTALVIGGGAIGLGAALALAAQGTTDIRVSEPNETRRAFLKQHCPFDIIDPANLADTDLFDIIVDGVGFEPTRATASKHARPGGVIGHIGLGSSTGGLDIRRMTLQEITFIGTYTYTADDFRATAQAIFDGRLGPLDWTEARALSDGSQAFTDIRAGTVAAPKIILKP